MLGEALCDRSHIGTGCVASLMTVVVGTLQTALPSERLHSTPWGGGGGRGRTEGQFTNHTGK